LVNQYIMMSSIISSSVNTRSEEIDLRLHDFSVTVPSVRIAADSTFRSQIRPSARLSRLYGSQAANPLIMARLRRIGVLDHPV